MISKATVQEAKNGQPVLVVNGRATASLVDPQREAQQWVQSQSVRLRGLTEGEPIVVLGGGSAYHLLALKESYAAHPILCFEVDFDVADFAMRSVHAALGQNHEIEIAPVDLAQGIEAFYRQKCVGDIMGGTFFLLRHKPSFLRAVDDFRQLEEWVTGRTISSLIGQIEVRPEIAARVDIESLKRTATEKGRRSLLSLRDLGTSWIESKGRNQQSRDRRIFRVLEELVR